MLKNIFNPGNYSNAVNFVILAMRLSAGLCMLSHGYGKFIKLFGDEPIEFADPIGLGQTASLALTVFAEVFCSILLVLGAATRFAAIPLFITMLVIIFVVHLEDGLKKMELPIFYSVSYFSLILTGGGKFSVDALLTKKSRSNDKQNHQ